MDSKILNYLEDNFSNFSGEPIHVHPITFKDGKIYFDFPLIDEEDTEFCSVPLEELIKDDFVVYEKTSPSIIRRILRLYHTKKIFKVSQNDFGSIEINYSFWRRHDQGSFTKYGNGIIINSCCDLNERLQIIKYFKENKTINKLLNNISLGPTLKVLEYIFGDNIKNIYLKD